MIKTVLKIRGMHCRSCEIVLEQELKSLPGIKSVQVSWKRKEATIYSRQPLDLDVIEAAIVKTGYLLGHDDPAPFFATDPGIYRDILISAFIILGLYFWVNILGLTKIGNLVSGNPSSLTVVLLIGLTAGFSTCMALVGGLVLGISAKHAEKHPNATSIQRFYPHLFFNLGRIAAYFILGGLVGLLGKAFTFNGLPLGFLTIIVGLVMLLLGLQLTTIFPKLSAYKLMLPTSIAKLLGLNRQRQQQYSHLNAVIAGTLTFFLPCGFTQAMQLFAMSTGSFWHGALIMSAFALGTAPGLLGVGGLTSIVRGEFAQKFFRFIALLVIIFALININTGIHLTGWRNIIAKKNQPQNITATQADKSEVQIIKTTFKSVDEDIDPKNFTLAVNRPVKLIIEVNENGLGCMSTIMIPGLVDKPVYLQKGKTITFDFVPKKKGVYDITCAMGVKRGELIVK